jgi:hypothetical protein
VCLISWWLFVAGQVEIIRELPADKTITVYRCGPLVDLCRGPHIPNTGAVKAFHIAKVRPATLSSSIFCKLTSDPREWTPGGPPLHCCDCWYSQSGEVEDGREGHLCGGRCPSAVWCACRLTCVASISCQAAAAYWRGDQSRESLQRVYGISYPNDTLLKVSRTLGKSRQTAVVICVRLFRSDRPLRRD